MSSGEDAVRRIPKTDEPLIRPRDEVLHIRRMLALHLDACIRDGSARAPLALVEARGAEPTPETRGLQREYLEALNANIRARTEYASIRDRRDDGANARSQEAARPGTNLLEDHLLNIKLQQKLEKLRAVDKYLGMLDEKQAALPSFLDTEELFRDTRPFPAVPKDMVEGITLNQAAAKTDLKGLVARLEKHVLRAKLLLQHEQELLEAIKGRSSARPDTVKTRAKLDALHATRNDLIAWMEAELGKASGDGGAGAEEGNGNPKHDRPQTGSTTAQIATIKEKYARYLAVRKALVQDVGQTPQPATRPVSETDMAKQSAMFAASPAPPPTAHLLTPYLEKLLQLSHQQKGMIAEKSHMNMVMAKQLKENCQVLNHLAEESQLLPSHSASGAHSRTRHGLGDGLDVSEALDVTSRVKPWVFAADSAKIATLETVTEKIDEGGLALEDAMKTLEEAGRLVGLFPPPQEAGQESSATEDDIWLAQGRPGDKSVEGRKHTQVKASRSAPGDVWDMIRGHLGLVGEDESPHRRDTVVP